MSEFQGTQIQYLEDRLAELSEQVTTCIAHWDIPGADAATNDWHEVRTALGLLRQER